MKSLYFDLEIQDSRATKQWETVLELQIFDTLTTGPATFNTPRFAPTVHGDRLIEHRNEQQ
jgi:hypothetical protein